MSNELPDDLSEESSRYDDTDPFEGLNEARRIECLVDFENFMLSDTWLYSIRAAVILLDIVVLLLGFKAICATGAKGGGVVIPICLFAVIFCFVITSVVFSIGNCKQRVEERLQAEAKCKAETELQDRLSQVVALTITDKVNFKLVLTRLLFCIVFVFILTSIFGIGVLIMYDGFDGFMRSLCTPFECLTTIIFVTLGASIVPICKILFNWHGSCLTFNEFGISGQVYGAFNYTQDVTGYYGEKTRSGEVIRPYYDINTDSQPHSIKWINFKCFSVHRNCLVLWQKEPIKADFLTKLYIKLGLNICLNQYPLRIVGKPAELAELKLILARIMPCKHNIFSGERAIL